MSRETTKHISAEEVHALAEAQRAMLRHVVGKGVSISEEGLFVGMERDPLNAINPEHRVLLLPDGSLVRQKFTGTRMNNINGGYEFQWGEVSEATDEDYLQFAPEALLQLSNRDASR